jgi:hypothetical protein
MSQTVVQFKEGDVDDVPRHGHLTWVRTDTSVGSCKAQCPGVFLLLCTDFFPNEMTKHAAGLIELLPFSPSNSFELFLVENSDFFTDSPGALVKMNVKWVKTGSGA